MKFGKIFKAVSNEQNRSPEQTSFYEQWRFLLKQK